MATIINNVTHFYNSNAAYIFRTNNGISLLVEYQRNSSVDVSPSMNCNLFTAIETIVGCFSEESNFSNKVAECFNCKDLESLRLSFNSTKVTVYPGDTAIEVYQQWENINDYNHYKKIKQPWLISNIMLFKNQVAEESWYNYAKNTSNVIITYARHLAKCMQNIMSSDELTPDIISTASKLVEGVTGTMHSTAINILIDCWKYGDKLTSICK